MDISDSLLTLFSATVKEKGDSYHIEIPKREISLGTIQSNGVYRIALLGQADAEGTNIEDVVQEQQTQDPPVEEGDQRTVKIEDIGDQGDGIARIERGYVVIVPETELGERVSIEISHVRDNVAFGEVVERTA
ncbi:TRAM domain-containing protein [Halostella sp. JP-L12]|uniref:TRAM domain-containing protein n=1 Tax=Halostella TaxID=1843185 RepID=UPI000EF83BD0|nr:MULTISPECIES: TRAM domain-containing protein [Halostella]NHN49299.1 TRAM domain-containing protein [Halostella sp. JP-L12]